MVALLDFQRRHRTRLEDLERGRSAQIPSHHRLPPRSSGNSESGPRLTKPVLSETCRAHAVATKDSRILEWCQDGGERVKVHVGADPARRVFLVHKALLRHYSDYFRGALQRAKAASGHATEEEFYLPDVDTAAFSRFAWWLYLCRSCKKGGARLYEAGHRCAQPQGDPDDRAGWCGLELEHDYALGDWLLCPRYCAFVMSHFVPHADEAGLGPDRLRWILDHTAPDSPLQRFARHWLCWRKLAWVEGKCPAEWTRHHPDLLRLEDGWAAEDPRKYELQHWESECSEPGTTANAMCPHRRDSARDLADGNAGDKKARRCGGQRLWDKYKEHLVTSFGLMVLLYHFIFPFAWVSISAFIIAADDDPLLFEASKYYSLVMGCLAVLGIWPICMRLMNMYFSMACSILVVIACVLSFASSSTCLAGADRDVERSICKMEIGVGVMQFFYAILVATSYKW